MKPFIKWPGGKRTELNQFMYLLPDFDRYIEPFVGGGAMYFALNPEKAVIGDTSEELMRLYQMLQQEDPELKRLLMLYSSGFDALKRAVEHHYSVLLDLYAFYALAQEKKLDIRSIRPHLTLTRQIVMDETVLNELILDEEEYLLQMEDAVEDKLIRTAKNNRNGTFTPKALRANIMTGFLSGFFLYFRSVYNQIHQKKVLCSEQYAIANFYFIRELCYGSMFRYNSKGEFNVPYGGMTYNQKDLAEKVRLMYSPEMTKLLQRTRIVCEDFETLMRSMELTERDFMFLDPPYDSDFSEYEGRPFDHEDQERLALFLRETKARFLLVIKNTEYIYNLYADQFRILAFENKYIYNIRRRNDRKAEHLIITNIPEGEVPWFRENYLEEV